MLINGRMGSNMCYGDSEWLGFWGEDLNIIIDLKDVIEVNKIKFCFFDVLG